MTGTFNSALLTDTELVAIGVGAILSFVLQVLKRWYTFTPEAIKGMVIILALAYSAGASIVAGGFNVWQFIFSTGAFIASNQAFFGLILNNTNTGDKLAGVVKDTDR